MLVPVPRFTVTTQREIQLLHSKGAGLLRLRRPFGMGTRVCKLNGDLDLHSAGSTHTQLRSPPGDNASGLLVLLFQRQCRQHQTFSPLFYRNGFWIDENEVSVYFLCFGIAETRGCNLLAATTQLPSKLTTFFIQQLNLSASDFDFIPSIS